MAYTLEFYSLSWDELEGDVARHPVLSTAADGLALSADAASAFVELVRAKGFLLGSLEHTSDSGGEFREDFLDGIAAERFGEFGLCDVFTERPVCSLKPDVFPAWGALTKAEIKEMLANYKPTENETENEDIESWLGDLAKILQEANDRGTDLITLYV